MAIEVIDTRRRAQMVEEHDAAAAALGATGRKIPKGFVWDMRKNPSG